MSTATLDAAAVKADFPLLAREVHGTPIVYLDSGATSQKPRAVLDAMDRYYEEINANVHRGAYHIAERATTASEDARRSVARFIGATDEHEVVFTKNATEAVNLVEVNPGMAPEPQGPLFFNPSEDAEGLFEDQLELGGNKVENAKKMASIPIWAFHGEKDRVVHVERGREMIEAIKKAGGKPRYSELPGVRHNSWTPAYKNPELWKWLFAQKKKKVKSL